MPFDKFMVAPLDEGLQNDVRPWLISDKAYSTLENAYAWRSRVKKRTGCRFLNGTVAANRAQLNSRLRINIGNTPGPLPIPGTPTQLQIGQMFSIGDDIFTITVLGAGVMTLSTNAAITGTIDSTVNPNTVTFAGAPPASTVYYYPSTPVMGFITPENAMVNDEGIFAFDMQFAYQFIGGGWERLELENVPGNALWSGSNSQFFQGTNFKGLPISDNVTFLFVTNFNPNEMDASPALQGMRYNTLLGTPNNTWFSFLPVIVAPLRTVRVLTARLIISFQSSLLLFNTIETINAGPQITYQNRVRYSRIGEALGANSFLSPDGTDGNLLDNDGTTEAIIGAEFLKNRLIVFYERSTWELVYTGNTQGPFRWQQINTELGVESTFSVVPFDKIVMGIGNTGVHACNGSNVERIDHLIPNVVFEIRNDNDGVFRVHGIRDYFREIVYWTFPDENPDRVFPTRLLVYNYKNGSWAVFDDSITAFGYFQNREDRSWSSTNETWDGTDWIWGTATQLARFRQVLAGNQEGFTFILDDTTRNNGSIQITNITTLVAPNIINIHSINHNLDEENFVKIEFALVDDGISIVDSNLNNFIFKVNSIIDLDNFTINIDDHSIPSFIGTYVGRGIVSRVSRINIRTKQFNFYAKDGMNAIFQKIDFLVDKTIGGQMQVNFFVSTGSQNITQQGAVTGALIGTGVLELEPYALVPLEAEQSRLWHPIYIQGEGEVIQLQITQSDEQMLSESDPLPSEVDFQLHAFTVYARRSGRLQ